MRFSTLGETIEETPDKDSLENKVSLFGELQETLSENDETVTFSTYMPTLDKAMEIFDNSITSSRSNYLFEDSTTIDGAVTDTANSLDLNPRSLRRKINGREGFANYHFNKLKPGSNDIQEEPADYKRFQYVETSLKNYFSKLKQEDNHNTNGMDMLSQAEPHFRNIDRRIAEGDLSVDEAPAMRESIIKDLKLESRQHYIRSNFDTDIRTLPYEAMMYAKSIELGRSHIDYESAKKEFKDFYLRTATEYSRLMSPDEQSHLDKMRFLTDYSPSYLQKRLGTSAGYELH